MTCVVKMLSLCIVAMYLEPTIPRNKKRRSSPLRVMILLILIFASLYVYATIQQEEVESPFTPTPTPTRSALSYSAEAEELYLQGRLEEAITAYKQAIALAPDNVVAYVPLSRLLVLEREVFEGIVYAQKAIEIAPENAPAWAALGMAYDWNGHVSKAIEACNQATELDPTYAEGYAYLGEAYADVQRWAEALEAVQMALKLDERSVNAHRNYGYVLELQGNYWEAVEAYQRALEIHPYLAYIHVSVGKNQRALGDVEAALSSFERAIEIDPHNAQAHFELGWTYLTNLGDNDQAKACFERAVEADPEFGRAYGGLAIAYWQRRYYEEAIPNFEQAIRLTSMAARQRARAFYVTIEEAGADDAGPSSNVVMRGDFAPVSLEDQSTLQATLTTGDVVAGDEGWAQACGDVTFDTRTGKYTLRLEKLPRLQPGQTYVGWFEGVYTLAGDPSSTGSLRPDSTGSVDLELEAKWVKGPAIDYFYTLGLAYFYMAECEKSYPLFEAALQIDPQEENALEGIRMCQEAR